MNFPGFQHERLQTILCESFPPRQEERKRTSLTFVKHLVAQTMKLYDFEVLGAPFSMRNKKKWVFFLHN